MYFISSINSFRIKLTSLLLTFLFVGSVNSVPAYPFPVTITQPDGTTLTIRLHGDEFRNFRTTEDGYLIKQNERGFYTFAERDTQNQWVPGNIIARDPANRTATERDFLNRIQKIDDLESIDEVKPVMNRVGAAVEQTASGGFPRTGSPRSLVILVEFTDRSFVTPNPQDAFHRLLNQPSYADNGGTGSARDYFLSASNGQFSPQFDVVGPYVLPNNMAYYGANDSQGNDVRPAYMIVDACSAAHNAGVNFAQYDVDGDGVLDNVFVFYAGYNEAEGGHANTIWPHKWVVSRGFNYQGTPNSVLFDGKRVFDYACTSELRGNSGSNMCGIGTFTHEFGHVIGLPDYYHTTENKATLGFWSIMDAGAYANQGRTPPTYSAYDRFFLGWLTPEQLTQPADKSLYPLSQSQDPLASTAKQSYLLSATSHNLNGGSPSPSEFFVMEYRKKTGWDTFLPAEGLLFWHIDFNQTAWTNNTVNNYSGSTQTASSHMRVYLRPLSGNTTTPGTAFTSGSFTPTTWAGLDINRPITEISRTSDSVTFKIMGGTPVNIQKPVIESGVIGSLMQYRTQQVGTEFSRYLNVKTTDITANLTVALTGDQASSFSVSATQIDFNQANSEEGMMLTVTFNPLSVGIHSATLTIFGGGLNPAKVINLTGEAVE